MNENTLQLPVDLKERRELLEKELKNTVSEQISQELTKDIRSLFDEYDIKGELALIEWEFHPESDDEGGTDWYPSYLKLSVDSETVEMEELKVNKKSKWSDSFYDYTLDGEIHDLINNWSDDLYNNDVEKLIINVGE